MKNISGIMVSLIAPMENHIANGGEKLLGNASSIKRRPDERVYISGQMQRHALFSAIERINYRDSNRASTYVSNGDGIDNRIELNLRADLGGFLHPKTGNYSGRRTSPLSVTPAVALNESEIGKDLLLKLKSMDSVHSLATKEFSQMDLMVMNFSLDITALSISKKYEYEDKGFHLNTEYVKHVNEEERKRRTKLFIEATKTITDYANQARNAISGEPQQVIIVFDSILSRKIARYFTSSEIERNNILNELDARNAIYFIGNDLIESNAKIRSVENAYKAALDLLANEETTLFDPCDSGCKIQTFAEAFKLEDKEIQD